MKIRSCAVVLLPLLHDIVLRDLGSLFSFPYSRIHFAHSEYTYMYVFVMVSFAVGHLFSPNEMENKEEKM